MNEPPGPDTDRGGADLSLEALVEAIDTLTARHEEQPLDREELVQLMKLRREAGRKLVTLGPGPLPHPPDDLFLGETGLPELAAPDLTADHLASGLRHHGALFVRGLFGPDDIVRAATDLNAGIHHGAFPEHPVDADGNPIKDAPLLGCSPGRVEDLLASFRSAGFVQVLTDYLGGRPIMVSERVEIRRRSKAVGLPWHQDGAFYGGTFGAVNVWLAMTPCGRRPPHTVGQKGRWSGSSFGSFGSATTHDTASAVRRRPLTARRDRQGTAGGSPTRVGCHPRHAAALAPTTHRPPLDPPHPPPRTTTHHRDDPRARDPDGDRTHLEPAPAPPTRCRLPRSLQHPPPPPSPPPATADRS